MWNGSLALWLVLAIMVFWVVGVYNRLMRIRARAMDALGSFEKHVRLYRTLALQHWQSVGVPADLLEGEHCQHPLPPLWAELMRLMTELEQASRAARTTGPHQEQLANIATPLDALHAVWAALCLEPDDLTGPVVPQALQLQWAENARRVESARSGFNQINARYNEAIAQFPARLLARTLRFTPAAIL